MASSPGQAARPLPLLFWLDVFLKAGLIVLLAFGALFGAFSEMQQYEGKAFLWRLVTYPVAAFAVPVIWAVFDRRRSYPFLADILLTLPFLIDTAGNALDLYDTISWWDDVNHLVNWGLLAGGVGALVSAGRPGFWATFAVLVAFGATTAILWEIAEYFAFIRNSPELATAYEDTLGDMALGLLGAVLAGIVFGRASRRESQGSQ